jgi:hypothetical protein
MKMPDTHEPAPFLVRIALRYEAGREHYLPHHYDHFFTALAHFQRLCDERPPVGPIVERRANLYRRTTNPKGLYVYETVAERVMSANKSA